VVLRQRFCTLSLTHTAAAAAAAAAVCCHNHATPYLTVTVADSGKGALDILRRSAPGTFQLILTVGCAAAAAAAAACRARAERCKQPGGWRAEAGALQAMRMLQRAAHTHTPPLDAHPRRPCAHTPRHGTHTHTQDLMMPEVDGLDILRYVRGNAALTDLPVIRECLVLLLQLPRLFVVVWSVVCSDAVFSDAWHAAAMCVCASAGMRARTPPTHTHTPRSPIPCTPTHPHTHTHTPPLPRRTHSDVCQRAEGHRL
jgi:CheY-like chemotaxis protein